MLADASAVNNMTDVNFQLIGMNFIRKGSGALPGPDEGEDWTQIKPCKKISTSRVTWRMASRVTI